MNDKRKPDSPHGTRANPESRVFVSGPDVSRIQRRTRDHVASKTIVVIAVVKIGLTSNTFHVSAVLLDQFSCRFGQDEALVGEQVIVVLAFATWLNQPAMTQEAKDDGNRGL
jgi:hypothetical protein